MKAELAKIAGLLSKNTRPEFTSTGEQAGYIEREFLQVMDYLEESESITLPRTWGFEIETPEADKVYHNTDSEAREVLEFHQDGSISGADGCECDCRSCTYHECNCESCEEYNDSPEHDCGGAWCIGQYQEIVSKGGLKTTKPTALEVLDGLGIRDCGITDECGLHIHIASQDLTPAQVARVLTAWRMTSHILDPIAGIDRKRNSYCKDHHEADEANARAGRPNDRYQSINTQSHYDPKWGRPQTLEVRKHRGTNNPDRVRAWAFLMVALVEFGKSSAPLYWLGKCQTLGDLVKALA